MCRVLDVERSGFYAWRRNPESKRAQEDKRLLTKIRQFWAESGFVYGYRNITKDLKDDNEQVGKTECIVLCGRTTSHLTGVIRNTEASVAGILV